MKACTAPIATSVYTRMSVVRCPLTLKTTTFSNQDSAKTLSICNAELLQRHKDRNSFRITGNTQGIELQNSVKFTEVLQYNYVKEIHFCVNFLTEKFVLSMIICIFAVSVPTKPLNDAQMRGAFFIYIRSTTLKTH